ncbi:MAG: preprotein translocase subunit SecE [Patescibacteria group bacterium]|nr:preprotein translocase subunit SecE [Patescibacteria group bacterium]
MAGFGQYLKDTRSELRHVAWPTRTQTLVYTILVAAISIVVALYLGLFDFLFTSGLSRVLEVLPSYDPNAITITQEPADSAAPTDTPAEGASDTTAEPAPTFDIPGAPSGQ